MSSQSLFEFEYFKQRQRRLAKMGKTQHKMIKENSDQFITVETMVEENHTMLDDIMNSPTIQYGFCVVNFTSDAYQELEIKRTNLKQLLFVSMVGAGGAGGLSYNGSMFYGGGGAGAGASFVKYTISLPTNVNLAKCTATIGQGGVTSGADGGDTTLRIVFMTDDGDQPEIILTAKGGKRGGSTDTDNQGGAGGLSNHIIMFNGENGEDGEITIPSIGTANGGNGGNSFFALGGTGGLNGTNTGLKGQDGKLGGGGGGSALGTNDIGKGGNGFIHIEF